MIYTDTGKIVTQDFIPLAMANGIEWSNERKGFKDRFNNLYRHGFLNRVLWFIGAVIGLFYKNNWRQK